MKRPILAINYYFGPDDLGNRIFSPDTKAMLAPYMREFHDFMAAQGVDVVTLDMVDFQDPNVKAVLYFEDSWRYALKDPFLKKVPFEKRALVLLEPAIVNPSMYYTSYWRRKFNIVFTWDLRLKRQHPEYELIHVPVGADLAKYRLNPFADKTFGKKKFLVAVSSNRWSFWPQATFSLRRKVYRYMHEKLGSDFDLFGHGWEKPAKGIGSLFGRRCKAWRGTIPDTSDEKVRRISDYKFMICFENSTCQLGYVSEKIFDCFCARTVPIYLGSKKNESDLPSGAYIDFRDFKSLDDLLFFLKSMSEREYTTCLDKINDFMTSKNAQDRSNDRLRAQIYDRLFKAG